MKKTLFFFLIFMLAIPFSTFAHKVNLFCYSEHDTVHGEAFFSQGSPVKHSVIEVYDQDTDALVGTTKTDDKGMFSLPVREITNIRVVLNAGMGHRTEYLLTRARTEDSAVAQIREDPVQAPLDYHKIAEIVQQELRPLHDDLRRLQQQQSRPDAGTIVGGLGWVVGIFSLLYLLRKKHAP